MQPATPVNSVIVLLVILLSTNPATASQQAIFHSPASSFGLGHRLAQISALEHLMETRNAFDNVIWFGDIGLDCSPVNSVNEQIEHTTNSTSLVLSVTQPCRSQPIALTDVQVSVDKTGRLSVHANISSGESSSFSKHYQLPSAASTQNISAAYSADSILRITIPNTPLSIRTVPVTLEPKPLQHAQPAHIRTDHALPERPHSSTQPLLSNVPVKTCAEAHEEEKEQEQEKEMGGEEEVAEVVEVAEVDEVGDLGVGELREEEEARSVQQERQGKAYGREEEEKKEVEKQQQQQQQELGREERQETHETARGKESARAHGSAHANANANANAKTHTNANAKTNAKTNANASTERQVHARPQRERVGRRREALAEDAYLPVPTREEEAPAAQLEAHAEEEGKQHVRRLEEELARLRERLASA